MNLEGSTFRTLYRQLLHISNRLPNASKRAEAVQLVKDKYRENVMVRDKEALTQLFKDANSRLGYLKMMTPRSSHRGYVSGGGSSRTFYFKGDKIDATKGMGAQVKLVYI
jgi:hypothetical protein